MPQKRIDLTGIRFGHLKVLAYNGSTAKHAMWTCTCDCGRVLEFSGSNLRSGNTRSCGCKAKAMKQNAHRLRAIKSGKVADLDAKRQQNKRLDLWEKRRKKRR